MDKTVFHGLIAATLTEAETVERLRLSQQAGMPSQEAAENVEVARENVGRRFNKWLESIPEK